MFTHGSDSQLLSRVSASLGLLVLLQLGCHRKATEDGASQEASGGRAVSLQLNWFPEVEHGGYYAAQVHGYFAKEGLQVEILPGGPNAPVVAQVDLGRATFGVANADRVLLGRDATAEIVALLAPLQTSPRCVMVHEASGIRTFAGLNGLTLAVSTGSTFFPFLEHKIDLTNVQIVAYSGSVAAFVNNPNYAQQAYVFSEPFLAEQAGAKPRSLMVADLGFNPYSSTLITHRNTLNRELDLARRMARACRKGWEHYLRDPTATNRRIAELNPEMSLEILRYGAQALTTLCDVGNAPFGRMTARRWQTLATQMHQVGLLQSPNAEGAYVLDMTE
jgi:NitT/TauT family transport system substrate-binding protein